MAARLCSPGGAMPATQASRHFAATIRRMHCPSADAGGLAPAAPYTWKGGRMEILGVGRLTLDEGLGWYYSAPVTASALGGAEGQIVVTEAYLTD